MKIVESGEDLYIKGSKSEEAVLCSGKQTFSLKRVETSNSGKLCMFFITFIFHSIVTLNIIYFLQCFLY